MRRRWILVRVLGSVALIGAIGLVIAIVVANVLGLSSTATALQQWGFWLLWGSIAAGVLWAIVARSRRHRRGPVPAEAVTDVNDIYLGRRPATAPSKSTSSYSAYPPDSEGKQGERQ